ncbi:hypothetical protein SCLCIDRAFT_769979 [Scleroderma citrinum Foug A]|uniref:Uncharacterized protein n=1 Tax=Scleroderma citrinum Foug A TaxID=1036808 RepID=A0A0C2ZNP1_9AGAM|nr:hypothetical protein SCLCIDRAFT_769979 [Scleroderma citrinum Foug A]
MIGIETWVFMCLHSLFFDEFISTVYFSMPTPTGTHGLKCWKRDVPRWRVVMLFKDMHVARALNWALQPFQILSTSQELIIAQRNIHGSMNISPSSACRTSIKEGLAPGVVKDVDFYDHRRVRVSWVGC